VARRLLVVNDEPTTGRALLGALALEGFDVFLVTDDAAALEVVADKPPDAVIVDVKAPESRGAALCRRLRQVRPRLPVLLLGGRELETERSGVLAAGADDYLARPFVLVELITRLRALLRRRVEPGTDVLQFADLTLDLTTREVRRGGRRIELTQTEFDLLELFLARPREVLARATIFNEVWGYDFGGTSNSLNVYVGHLRRKLEAGGEPRLIHTVRGVGYVLRDG
jgi:two-component system, OmpR family, response regulator MprA